MYNRLTALIKEEAGSKNIICQDGQDHFFTNANIHKHTKKKSGIHCG